MAPDLLAARGNSDGIEGRGRGRHHGGEGGATWGLWRTMVVRWCGLGGEVLRRCSRGGRGCSAHEPRDGESVNALAVVAASQRW